MTMVVDAWDKEAVMVKRDDAKVTWETSGLLPARSHVAVVLLASTCKSCSEATQDSGVRMAATMH